MYMVGADCEVFIKDGTNNFKSVIGLIGGSKIEPRKTKHGYVQEDNVLAEFNVNPASDVNTFYNNTRLVLQDLDEIIKPLGLNMDIRASAHFDMKELQHPLAQQAGCEPDFNAWALCVNQKPSLSGNTLRSAGGHVHVSWDRLNEDPYMRPWFVRVMDLVAGVPSILMDKDTDRRSLYGAAGCFRPKFVMNGHPYDGVEYRTLSSFWLQSEETIRWVFSRVEKAILEFDELLKIANEEQERILKAINGSCAKTSRGLIRAYNL
jgi:hypothetical protein